VARPLLPLLLCACALAPAARGEPRLTLRLENATLAETLGHLERFYGRRFPTGAETAPGAPARASFDWREAGPGVVYRDVAAAFHCLPTRTHDGAVRFEPGKPAPGGFVLHREGLGLTLGEVRQRETRAARPGAAAEAPRRELVLALTLRALDGDPQTLVGLDVVRARDSTGRTLRPTGPAPRWNPKDGPASGFPDEWRVEVALEGPAPAARELAGLELEALVRPDTRTHRLEAVGVAGAPVGGPRAVGPVQVRPLDRVAGPGFVLVWPRGVEVGAGAGEEAGIALFARRPGGDLRRVPLAFGGVLVDERGEHSAQYGVRSATPADGPLVWDVTARAGPERRVAFRFARLPLPLAGPGGSDAPYAGTASLLLTVPGGRPGELTLGLARAATGGRSGPVRWSTVETDAESRARVDDLAPGVYRLQATFRPRDGRGNLAAALALRPVAAVTLTAGRLTPLTLTRP